MNKPILSRTERQIITILYYARRALTTSEVADKGRMAWKTAKDNLISLSKKGYVACRDYGNRIYWWLV